MFDIIHQLCYLKNFSRIQIKQIAENSTMGGIFPLEEKQDVLNSLEIA